MNSLKSFLSPEQKIGGILTPVSALRGKNDLGVGDTETLVEFAEWACKKGFRLIQILPVNETGSDHSPYNIISSIAYEPCTLCVNPKWLPDVSVEEFEDLSKKHDVESLREGPVRYGAVKAFKRELLAIGYKNLNGGKGNRARVRAFEKFVASKSEWLEPYALFRALCSWNNNDEVLTNWPEEHLSPESARDWLAALETKKKHQVQELISFYSYVQWIAAEQWLAVRAAFDKLGMALMGDIPVGVSIYSADVWAEPRLFDLKRSSGAPPEKVFKSDPFTENWGQNWGFPLYNWETMSRDDFAWWRRRLREARSVFHLLRVDHALGFFRIYNFPWRPEENSRFTYLTPEQAKKITGGPLPGFAEFDDSTAENRERNRCQGDMLFRMLLEETRPHRLIAEDLGELSPYVRPTLEALEIPGFKIPQWERDKAGVMLPGASYQRLSLATFATHDHPTIRQFWEEWIKDSLSPGTRTKALDAMQELLVFCGRPDLQAPQEFTPEIHALLINGLFACNSWLAMHQITDIFGLRERFNVPGAVGDTNWTTRVNGRISEWDKMFKKEILTASLALKETGRHIAVKTV